MWQKCANFESLIFFEKVSFFWLYRSKTVSNLFHYLRNVKISGQFLATFYELKFMFWKKLVEGVDIFWIYMLWESGPGYLKSEPISGFRHATLLYSTLLYSTLLYATLRYSTLLYATLRYSMLLYATLRYSTLLPTRHLKCCWSDLMCKSDQKIWYEYDSKKSTFSNDPRPEIIYQNHI
jgi:hypothetical protein